MKEWVAVKKRKPSKSMWVYVAKRMKDDHSIVTVPVSLVWYSKKDDEFSAFCKDGEEIYAWMPHYFPKPPDEDYFINKRNLPCVCGCKRQWYHVEGNYYSFVCPKCKRAGEPVEDSSYKESKMRKNWNDMVRAEAPWRVDENE